MKNRKFKIIIFSIIIILGIIVGKQIYSNIYDINHSYVYGTGTMNDPFVLKNNGNKVKQECDNMTRNYLQYSNLKTIEFHPTRDDSHDLETGTRGFDYGVYKINQLDQSNNIQITDIHFGSSEDVKYMWLLVTFKGIPDSLTKITSNKPLGDKLRLEKTDEEHINSYVRVLGNEWISTISKDEKKIIDDSVAEFSLVSLTYIVQYQNYWYSSSILLKWEEFVTDQKPQRITLPEELIQLGSFSIPMEIISEG